MRLFESKRSIKRVSIATTQASISFPGRTRSIETKPLATTGVIDKFGPLLTLTLAVSFGRVFLLLQSSSSSSSSFSVGVEVVANGWTKDDDDWGNKLAPMGLNPGPGVWTFGESGTRKTLGASYGPRGQKLRFLTKEYRELAFGFGAPLPGLEGGKPATSAGKSSPPT